MLELLAKLICVVLYLISQLQPRLWLPEIKCCLHGATPPTGITLLTQKLIRLEQ